MKRPSYRAGIDWLVDNDDTEWALDHSGDRDADAMSSPAVTACLLADLFGVDVERVRKDVRRGLEKAGRLAAGAPS